MKSDQHNHLGDTVRLRRPPRIITDELGRNIWADDVEPIQLELEDVASYNPYDTATDLQRYLNS